MKLNKYTLMTGTLASALVLGACSTVSADENLEWTDEDNNGVATVQTEETNEFKYSVQEAVDAASERFSGGVTEVELDEDDNTYYYEIEMENGEDEYEVKINADDLSVSEEEIDREDDDGEETKKAQSENTTETDAELIGMEKAVQIAKDEVGGGDVTDKEFDKDDNDYEIELDYDGSEYDIEINAATGEVTDIDQENESGGEYTNNIEFDGDYMSSEEALNIALDAVGGGTVDEWDLDKDDNEYDIEIDYDGSEFEVEIHATSGKVIKVEQDD